MENIIDFPNRETIETEACAWVSKIDAHEGLEATDAVALREWVARSPLHYQELRRVAGIWGDLDQLTELLPALNQLPTQTKPSLLAGLTDISWLWGGSANATGTSANSLTTSLTTRFASVALIAVVLTLAVIIYPGDPDHRTYVTAIGEQRRIELPDGSTIQLNTASQVQIDFDSATRTVHLESGQAHFEVAHNKTRPFLVMAGDGRVRAVGTAFSVYVNKKNVEVIVTEGQVEVAANQLQLSQLSEDIRAGEGAGRRASKGADKSPVKGQNPANIVTQEPLALVNANQNIRYNGTMDKVRSLEQEELTKKLSWRQGMLLFSGETLEQVVTEVSRYTTKAILITDPSIRDIRIAGYFKADDTQALFEALSISFGVQVKSVNRNLVHISRLSSD